VSRLTLLPLLLYSACSVAQMMAEPVPFRAEYEAQYQGLPVKARGIRELVQLEGDRYRMTSSASSFLARIIETSEFRLTEEKLTPLAYDYKRQGLGKNKAESTQFDWTAGIASHDGTESLLAAGTLDKLSYQLQLRRDVARALAEGRSEAVLEYEIADMEKRKVYRFAIAGMETMSTPLGELNTVRLDRVREADKNRETSLWLAVDHAFLLVKLKQTEADKGFELNLNSAVLDGRPL